MFHLFKVSAFVLSLSCSLQFLFAEDITTGTGDLVWYKSASLTLGRYGPLLLDDIQFFDEIAHFNRERPFPRVVHAGGTGALGYFEVTEDITEYCASYLFKEIGLKTPVSVRFSGSFGEIGAPTTARDQRGFAVKFYTKEGNWDLVGLGWPVFPLRDPALFGSLFHVFQRDPVSNVVNYTNAFDGLTLRPETAHFLIYYLSPYAIPASFRTMDGFPVNVFKLINAKGEYVYARFSFFSDQGLQFLNLTEAATLAATNPGYLFEELYDSILAGNYPSWTLKMQVLTETELLRFPFDAYDNTKFWPESLVPYKTIGKMVLNQIVDNHFAQVEQVAMSPANLVPGIRPSPDKVFQGRLFAYPDAQRYRIGPNYLQLPINRPVNGPHNYQRDGRMAYDNRGNAINYYPNSRDNLTLSENAKQLDPPFPLFGIADRYDNGDEDNFSQAQYFYEEVLDDEQRLSVAQVIVELASRITDEDIALRALELIGNISSDLLAQVQQLIAESS